MSAIDMGTHLHSVYNSHIVVKNYLKLLNLSIRTTQGHLKWNSFGHNCYSFTIKPLLTISVIVLQ